jgi:hypothetical protein
MQLLPELYSEDRVFPWRHVCDRVRNKDTVHGWVQVSDGWQCNSMRYAVLLSYWVCISDYMSGRFFLRNASHSNSV